jgi:hypothetical protein
MSEEYVVISFVIFITAVFLISFILSVIEGEINEWYEVRRFSYDILDN